MKTHRSSEKSHGAKPALSQTQLTDMFCKKKKGGGVGGDVSNPFEVSGLKQKQY